MKDKVVRLVSSFRSQNLLLKSYLKDTIGVECECSDSLHSTEVNTARNAPWNSMILCDSMLRDASDHLAEMESVNREVLLSHLVCLFNVRRDAGLELPALDYGVRGFFYEGDPPEHIAEGIRSVFEGELWITKEIMLKCISGMYRMIKGDNDLLSSDSLTFREKGILRLLARGCSNDEIAEKLSISSHTVKTHLYNAYKKLNVSSRVEAALWTRDHLS